MYSDCRLSLLPWHNSRALRTRTLCTGLDCKRSLRRRAQLQTMASSDIVEHSSFANFKDIRITHSDYGASLIVLCAVRGSREITPARERMEAELGGVCTHSSKHPSTACVCLT